MAISDHAANSTKILKLVLNVIILVLYKHGDEGYFLGVNFNKNRDAEALAAGVYVGYLVYNLVVIISTFFNSKSVSHPITETLMNAVGFVLWIITAGVGIQFWLSFIPSNHMVSQNPTGVGLAMGALSIVVAALYLGETVLTFVSYKRNLSESY